jgi:hypothetical protein
LPLVVGVGAPVCVGLVLLVEGGSDIVLKLRRN